ncbi:MAG: cell wall hydrolase [Bacillota bacterium]|jgi:N-acetylmuramoyl-L-alanine amidase|nr:cell wall hydrolase [Bacillota bacterium]HHT91408.1 LysM peptidoglycan-binding domain-containing protein [Bacillota bacterium]
MRNILLVLGALLLFFSIGRASSYPSYTVRPGDTLYEISLQYGISWKELASLNKIKDPTTLQVGTHLRLPAHAVPKTARSEEPIVELTAKEKDLLVRLVAAEARGEGLEGQIAVAAVIFNRVQSSRFPHTVWDVIHQPGQFTPIQNGTLPKSAGNTCLEAVERALYGEDPTGGALFFYNPSTTAAADYWATKPVIKRIGNHNFTL